MDAAEFLERVGADHASLDPEPWERDRLTESDWLRIEHGRPMPMLATPWRADHTDQWRTV